jgi:hypothetical protein
VLILLASHFGFVKKEEKKRICISKKKRIQDRKKGKAEGLNFLSSKMQGTFAVEENPIKSTPCWLLYDDYSKEALIKRDLQ